MHGGDTPAKISDGREIDKGTVSVTVAVRLLAPVPSLTRGATIGQSCGLPKVAPRASKGTNITRILTFDIHAIFFLNRERKRPVLLIYSRILSFAVSEEPERFYYLSNPRRRVPLKIMNAKTDGEAKSTT